MKKFLLPKNTRDSKCSPPQVFVFNGKASSSFPYGDPCNPIAGIKFCVDCIALGWPIIRLGRHYYVFTTIDGDKLELSNLSPKQY